MVNYDNKITLKEHRIGLKKNTNHLATVCIFLTQHMFDLSLQICSKKKKKFQGNFNLSFVLPDFLLPVCSSRDVPHWAVHTSLKDFCCCYSSCLYLVYTARCW